MMSMTGYPDGVAMLTSCFLRNYRLAAMLGDVSLTQQ